MDVYIYDDILNIIQITAEKLLHFKLTKSSQILCVDKNGFPWPIHIYIHTCIHIYAHTYVYTCIHTYMHTYMHMYMCNKLIF